MDCMKATIGVLLGLFSLSSAMYYLKHGPFAPKDIETFDIDLGREHSFVVKVDFQTHSGHTKGDDKSGYYHVAIASESLTPNDPEKNALWRELLQREKGLRSGNEMGKMHTGKVTLAWSFSEGIREEIICEGFAGSMGFGNSVLIGGKWLPARDKRQVSEVTVTVARIDTLLAKHLKFPKIWIYRGGGK